MMKFYPFKFKPIFKYRIWGGQKLREVFGKDIPADTKIGESWELADLPEDKSEIINGDLAGQTLDTAVARYRKEITGCSDFPSPFPLLIKFLDAEDILSVQVHPDAETCRRMGKGQPKTECWYIISAAQDAVIYKGLKTGVTREAFAKAIEQGTVEELLNKVPVKAGECHFLPAGTTHAIGAGLLIAEIQTPSDTTYRVFDWNRVEADGKPRPLHIEEALQSIRFDRAGEHLPVTTIGRLVDCEHFNIDKGHQAKNCELLLPPGQLKAMVILTGRGRIEGKDSSLVEFAAGDTLLTPAIYEGAMCFTADTEYLTISI